jgi:hypothetical protein
MAKIEAEKTSECASVQAKAEAEKKALLDRLSQMSGVTDDERLKRAATIREMWA